MTDSRTSSLRFDLYEREMLVFGKHRSPAERMEALKARLAKQTAKTKELKEQMKSLRGKEREGKLRGKIKDTRSKLQALKKENRQKKKEGRLSDYAKGRQEKLSGRVEQMRARLKGMVEKRRETAKAKGVTPAKAGVNVCGAKTARGKTCTRKVATQGAKCWQHGGKGTAVKPKQEVKPKEEKKVKEKPTPTSKPKGQDVLNDLYSAHKEFSQTKKGKALAGVMDIPALYNAIREKNPNLTIDDFHKNLEKWWKDGKLELSIADSPSHVDKPEQGIKSKHGLLYYVKMPREEKTSEEKMEAPTPARLNNVNEHMRKFYSKTFREHQGYMTLDGLFDHLERQGFDRERVKQDLIQLKNQGKLRFVMAVELGNLKEKDIVREGRAIYYAMTIGDLLKEYRGY